MVTTGMVMTAMVAMDVGWCRHLWQWGRWQRLMALVVVVVVW